MIALVTTTINLPTVLKLYRACSVDVEFFVTGDMKSDSILAMRYCRTIPNCRFYDVVEQQSLGYACSDLIGWNTVSRRSIAILEALKSGADWIVTIDDDNTPMDRSYFSHFKRLLDSTWPAFDGLAITGFNGWFDYGKLLVPPVSQRGFPHDVQSLWAAKPVTGARIGLAAGMCFGDPDVSAIERIANEPEVHGMSELLRAGIVVDPGTRTVVNTQNTAFLRELAPCFLLPPAFGRYDDIFASLVCQRVMRGRGLHVHLGLPTVWQTRNEHDLLKDLEQERFGMLNIRTFSDWLDEVDLPGETVLDDVRAIYAGMASLAIIPAAVVALGKAWCDDVSKVL